jgi:hypothetical protein
VAKTTDTAQARTADVRSFIVSSPDRIVHIGRWAVCWEVLQERVAKVTPRGMPRR